MTFIVLNMTPQDHGSDSGHIERMRAVIRTLKAEKHALERSFLAAGLNAASHFSALVESQKELAHAQAQVAAVTLDFEVERKANERMAADLDDLQSQNSALRQDVELRDRQLEAGDKERDELHHALAIAKLSASSRNNVLDLLRDAT
ncbi:hypothetical protein [Chromobacterium haemolyticum]|uniref:hypothetical protein n=1 Tax=Chromobacterium haemolyticum TaxID=394935 RepID=UPI0009D9A40C|nr:hypothetical protein [Chromobacterium haemolyticum]OQS32110.1 hypothetical protein B0T39_23045 [Chromobacterium haemolyticum]